MQTPAETATDFADDEMPGIKIAAPSADFIQAISRFLDTDPSDLLQELGYYRREDSNSSA